MIYVSGFFPEMSLTLIFSGMIIHFYSPYTQKTSEMETSWWLEASKQQQGNIDD